MTPPPVAAAGRAPQVLRRLRQELRHVQSLLGTPPDARGRGQLEMARHLVTVLANADAAARRPRRSLPMLVTRDTLTALDAATSLAAHRIHETAARIRTRAVDAGRFDAPLAADLEALAQVAAALAPMARDAADPVPVPLLPGA